MITKLVFGQEFTFTNTHPLAMSFHHVIRKFIHPFILKIALVTPITNKLHVMISFQVISISCHFRLLLVAK